MTINSNNFDTNIGIWVDGGTDCLRTNNATYANSPAYSMQLRDNTTTSVMSTTNQNFTSYEELTVFFAFYAVSFEAGEDFWVQISTNGGSTYTTIGDFNAGTQFTNGVHKTASVVIPGPFTSTTRVRFRADASDDGDQIYIDDVRITGCQSSGLTDNGSDERGNEGNEDGKDVGISNFVAGPNPATDNINIQFDAAGISGANVLITDLAGRVVLQNDLNVADGQNRATIPVSSLTNGLYLLRLQAGDETITVKIVLAR